MALKVLHLSTYGANGGAARAASTLHKAMLQQGMDSELRVAGGPRFKVARALDRQLWRFQSSPTQTWRSPARFGSLSADEINASDADVVNLHWVTDGFLSIKEIGRITKPLVWTLYDMWPFCGTEHYGVDTPDARWRTGYSKHNRPPNEGGIDLDRLTWEEKVKHWRPAAVVPASTWLTEAAASSSLMGSWSITRIPHVVDTDVFRDGSQVQARARLGLPQDIPLILFLASAGITDRRKGFDLLEQALPAVRDAHPEVELIVAGPTTPNYVSPSGVPIRWQGPLTRDEDLVMLYTAADVLAVPSREDNMPLTAMEAQSCSRPVVAFSIGGLPDIVDHGDTGYLAAEGDIDDLASGLSAALTGAQAEQAWGGAAGERATATWSCRVVVQQYESLYANLLR